MSKTLPYEWLVGLRYTRAGRRSGRNRFLSFISLISVAGIALGVASLIIVLSIMNGFQTDVRDRMLSVLSHIEVSGRDGALPEWQGVAERALRHQEVVGAAPFVAAEAMLTHGRAMQGAMVRGILNDHFLNGRACDVFGLKHISVTAIGLNGVFSRTGVVEIADAQ